MREVDGGTPTVISGMGCASWDSLKIVARRDPDVFCEFVLREKRKGMPEIPGRGIQGQPVVQHRIHCEMQDALTRERHIVVLGHPECGKTQQLGVGRMLFEIGNNLDNNYALIGNTQGAAKKTLLSIKTYIERSDELRAVFPKLIPGALWTSEMITVERTGASRDPTVQTVGYHGDILGSRLDGWVADDYLDHENTRTEEGRRESESWFRRSVLTRELEGAWGAFLTNAWHERDFTSSLKRDGWKLLVYPVLDANGAPTWPERWGLSRIATTRRLMGVSDFVRLFMCKPRDENSRTFMPEAVDYAFELGQKFQLLERIHDAEVMGELVVTGVDLGASRRRGGKTVLSTITATRKRRQTIGMRSGRGNSGWLFDQMEDVAERYGGVMVVESNGIQKMIVEVAQTREIEIPVPVVPFQTNRNKHAPETGIAAMAAEFDEGMWYLPERQHPEMQAFEADLDSYDPETHTGDHLMATWFARTYARRMLAPRRDEDNDIGVLGLTPRGAGARKSEAEKLHELEEVARTTTSETERSVALADIARLWKRVEARAGAITLSDLQASS